MMVCPFCGSGELNIVTKDVCGPYTTWDCVCGAHGMVKKGIFYPNKWFSGDHREIRLSVQSMREEK